MSEANPNPPIAPQRGTEPLDASAVRRIAELSRLNIPDDQVADYGQRLSAVLTYMDRLREIDVSGVEPMSQPNQTSNRLREDVPGPTLPRDVLMAIAPETLEPFVKIPKVIGDGGGA